MVNAQEIISELETIILQLQSLKDKNIADNIKADLQAILVNLNSLKEKAVTLKNDINTLSTSYPTLLKAIEILIFAIIAKIFTNSL